LGCPVHRREPAHHGQPTDQRVGAETHPGESGGDVDEAGGGPVGVIGEDDPLTRHG